MHFIVTAYDGKDSMAGERRENMRERHLKGILEQKKEGKHIYGAVILNDENNMIGSMLIVDYPSKETLVSEWLDNEPYITGGVWKEIDIKPCKVPDFFLNVEV